MHQIAAAFEAGNFSVPGFVHAREVPGTRLMAARRHEIRYEVESLPRGGALRLTSAGQPGGLRDPAFLAFQRKDHRAVMYHDE